MKFTTTLFSAFSILSAVHAQEVRSPEGFKYFSDVGPVSFSTKLKDGKDWHLTVFDDLVLSPKATTRPLWSFKKTSPQASFDTFWYQPDNKVAVWHEPTQTFSLRRVEQVAVGWFNLTPKEPVNYLKFLDTTDFRACRVAGPAGKRYGYLKKLTKGSVEPAWALPGSCENFKLTCTGCP